MIGTGIDGEDSGCREASFLKHTEVGGPPRRLRAVLRFRFLILPCVLLRWLPNWKLGRYGGGART